MHYGPGLTGGTGNQWLLPSQNEAAATRFEAMYVRFETEAGAVCHFRASIECICEGFSSWPELLDLIT